VRNPSVYDRLSPSKNLNHITAEIPPTEVYTRAGKTVAMASHHLHERDRLRSRLNALQDVDYTPLNHTANSWEELQGLGIDVFENHADQLHALSDTGTSIETAIRHAGTAGAGVVGAFLRIIPEFMTPQDQYASAKESVRTVMTWAAFSADADKGLTYLICNPKPDLKLPDRDLYTGLTFDPEFFTVTESRVVELDNDRLERITKEEAKTIDRHLQGTDVFYGCPFRIQIPKLYRAMAYTAARSGLLG
jgi:hypothetical protein